MDLITFYGVQRPRGRACLAFAGAAIILPPSIAVGKRQKARDLIIQKRQEHRRQLERWIILI